MDLFRIWLVVSAYLELYYPYQSKEFSLREVEIIIAVLLHKMYV